MNVELIEKCNLLVKNRNTIREALKWDRDVMTLAGSSFYAGLGQEADPETLKVCDKILKEKEGIFSEYRGNVKMPLLCKMAVSEHPEKYFEEIHTIVEHMKNVKWISKDYKILAAITIHDHTEQDRYQDAVAKMVDLYQGMKANHPWLTSGEDIPFAAMLAVSDLDTNALLTEMGVCYQVLKEHFPDKNAVQSLSHVLAVDKTEINEKCNKVVQIWTLLKDKKHKYGTGYELAVLGTLCMLDMPVDAIVEEIIEADEYLKPQKGFGDLHMGQKTRIMYAALMVMDAHMPPASRSHESLLDSMLSIVIAMEICMLAIVSTVCVTTSTN